MTYIYAAHSGEGYEGAPGVEVVALDGHARIHVVGYDYSCVPTDDLAAALRLVTREEYDQAGRDLAEARELARQRHEANSAIIGKLNEAEATIARVEEWWNDYGHYLPRSGQAAFDATLHPAPAFALPTEPGVRFAAEFTRSEISFLTVDNGDGSGVSYLREDKAILWHGDTVMNACTGHRLIETAP